MGWSIKTCDLQKIPGGISWATLRPTSISPMSMKLSSGKKPSSLPVENEIYQSARRLINLPYGVRRGSVYWVNDPLADFPSHQEKIATLTIDHKAETSLYRY